MKHAGQAAKLGGYHNARLIYVKRYVIAWWFAHPSQLTKNKSVYVTHNKEKLFKEEKKHNQPIQVRLTFLFDGVL